MAMVSVQRAPEMGALAHAPVSGSMIPMDQSNTDTCVAYAFATVLSANMMGKFSIGIDRHELVTVARTAVECWNGRRLVDFCDEWNLRMPSVNDVSQYRRYKVRVNFTALRTIEEAYAQLEYLEPARMVLMCAIHMDDGPHTSHAVTVTQTDLLNRPHMVALNSWGARHHPHKDVTRANFQYALAINPVIIECFEGSTRVPPAWITTSRHYNQLGDIQAQRDVQARQRAEERAAAAEAHQLLQTARHEAEQARTARRAEARRARELEQRSWADDGAAYVAAVSNAWNAHSAEHACVRMSVWCEEYDKEQANRRLAANAGAIEAVVAVMREYPDAPGVQEMGCKALLSICRGSDSAAENRKRRAGGIGGADAFTVVVAGMRAHPQDAGVQIAGCALVKGLCTYLFDVVAQCAAEAGAIGAVAEAMRAHPLADRVQIIGSETLYGICIKSYGARRYLAAAGVRVLFEQEIWAENQLARRVLDWVPARAGV
jgi:hypothetical protein